MFKIIANKILTTLVAAAIALASVAPAGATETRKVLGQLAPAAAAASITCTNASPMVCTWTGSNLAAGDQFFFSSGTPPTGGCSLALNTIYYVIAGGLGANTFEIATTFGGSACNSTSTGTTLVGSIYRILYTVPAAKSTVISTIVVANRAGSLDLFRVAVQPAGVANTNASFIAFGETVPANDSIIITIGITLATTDIITVWSTNGTSTFTAFGAEVQ